MNDNNNQLNEQNQTYAQYNNAQNQTYAQYDNAQNQAYAQYDNSQNQTYAQYDNAQNQAYAQYDNAQNQTYAQNQAYAQGMPSNVPLLQINDLCKRYPGMGSYMSVFHMNLTIPRGRIIGLLGPNGCGKSTLIKMINGLLAPTSGTVLINGMNPCAATKKVVSYLPERTYLDNGLKVSEMINYFCDFYEDFSPEKAYSMLESLGINPNARLKTL